MRRPPSFFWWMLRCGRPARALVSSWLLPLAGLTGCGGTSDPQRELDTVASWTATIQLAVDEHRAGAISSTYAQQLERAANDALANARRDVIVHARDSASARRARAPLDSLARAIHVLHADLSG